MVEAIEKVGEDAKPHEWQLSSGTTLPVNIAAAVKTKQWDVLVAQVKCPGDCDVVPSDANWVLRHSISSGPGPDDVKENIYTYIVSASPPTSVTFSFTTNLGEKWAGIQTWRNVDVSELMVSAIAGSNVKTALLQLLSNGFHYSYSDMLPGLLRPENAIGYSYIYLLRRLTAKNGFGYSYSDPVEPAYPAPTGRIAVLASFSGPYFIIDRATKATETGWPTLSGVTSGNALAWSPDGMRLAVGYTGDSPYYTVIDAESKTIEAGWPAAAGHVQSLRFSPDGTRLFMGSSQTSTLQVVDVATKTVETGWPNISGAQLAIDVSSDGSMVAVGSNQTSHLRIIDVATKTALVELAPGRVNALRFSPDGARLYVGLSAAPYFLVLDVASATFEEGWDISAITAAANGVEVTELGGKVIVGSSTTANRVNVFDTVTKKSEVVQANPTGAAQDVAYTGPGLRFAVAVASSPGFHLYGPDLRFESGWPSLGTGASAIDFTPHKPFTPAEIDTALWLESDAIEGLADLDLVASWSDLSGNARHATQADDTRQPTYRANIINGKPVVRFDGSNDFLQALLGSARADRTIFVVAKEWNRNGTSNRLWDLGTPTWSGEHSGIFMDGAWNYYAPAVTLGGVSTDAALITIRYDSTSAATAFRNQGAGVAFDPNDNAALSDRIALGSNAAGSLRFSSVDIAALIVVDQAVDDTLRGKIEGYLARKWLP